jgi:iron complex outermembrane recepter protein
MLILPVSRLSLRSFALSATALTSVLAGQALAQTAPAQTDASADEARFEDIIVTAQRRQESLMDVPIPIAAVSAVQMQRQNVNSIEDVLEQIPNVSFVTLGSRDRKEISMRGISNQLNPFVDVRSSTYAFYIDEFNVAVGTSNPEIVDLERVEVLRGPQGTYFGRNAVGGAINVITKKPGNDWYAEVGGGYSSFDTWNAHLVGNIPIIQDVLAFRASGQLRRTEGFIKNINPIGGGNDGEFNTARGTLRFTPIENLVWDVNFSYTDGREGMRVGVPTGFLTATWRAVYYQNRQGNVASPDGVGFYPTNRNKVNFNRPQNVGSDFSYVSSKLTYEFDAFSVTAVGGHLWSSLFNFGDVDGGSIDAFYEDLYIRRKSTSGELRLQSLGDNWLGWSIGANYGEDSGVQDQSTFHGRQSPLNRPDGFEITGADSDTTSTYWAIFGELTWNIMDDLKFIVGGRYSHEKVKTIGQTRSNTIITGNNNRSASFNDFSPRFTLSWKPDENAMIYATVSKGFKSGGTQTTGTVQLRNEYDPEELWNYEIGLKADFLDKRLRVDIAGFYMDWKNVQQFIRFQFIDPNTGLLRGVTGIDNATSARTYGLEMAVDAILSDNFRSGFTLGYLNARYGDYRNALIDGRVIDASGKRLINAPEWTFGVHAEYNRDLVADYNGFIRVEGFHKSEQLSSTFALRYEQFPFFAPSYNVVNLRLGVSNDRYSVIAYAENLLDENYFANAYEKAFFSGVQVEPSVRVFGVKFSAKFGPGR